MMVNDRLRIFNFHASWCVQFVHIGSPSLWRSADSVKEILQRDLAERPLLEILHRDLAQGPFKKIWPRDLLQKPGTEIFSRA